MKSSIFLIVFVLFSLQIFSQTILIADKQLMLGVFQVNSNEEVTHFINAKGDVWERINSNYVISSDQSIYYNSLTTTGNANFGSPDWPGFNFKWLNNYPPSGVSWGLGFYKVTNSKNPTKYFYLDARDSDFANRIGGTDFWVYYDTDESLYNWKSEETSSFVEISNGEIIGIWEIMTRDPNTSGLQDYWSNVLVSIGGLTQHPKIVWGPNTSFAPTHYKVYRAFATMPTNPKFLNFHLLATTGSSTYEYTDTEFLIDEIAIKYAYYYVKAYKSSNNSYSTATNTISIAGQYNPFKIASDDLPELLKVFELNQNYPNPFNPTTIINYSIPKNDFVSIKIYDSIGKLVSTLVNSTKESGNYTVSFNSNNLSSGLYFYTLRTSSGSITKKMLLVR